MDQFLASHSEDLVVVSAGNGGAYGAGPTLNSPALAKNGLAVGASQVWQRHSPPPHI